MATGYFGGLEGAGIATLLRRAFPDAALLVFDREPVFDRDRGDDGDLETKARKVAARYGICPRESKRNVKSQQRREPTLEVTAVVH